MSQEHTPGPWRPCAHLSDPSVDESCGCGYPGAIWSADGETIVCEMGVCQQQHSQPSDNDMQPIADRPTQHADARLISKSPEMHDVLTWLVNLHHGVSKDGGHPSADEWGDALREAQNLLADMKRPLA